MTKTQITNLLTYSDQLSKSDSNFLNNTLYDCRDLGENLAKALEDKEIKRIERIAGKIK